MRKLDFGQFFTGRIDMGVGGSLLANFQGTTSHKLPSQGRLCPARYAKICAKAMRSSLLEGARKGFSSNINIHQVTLAGTKLQHMHAGKRGSNMLSIEAGRTSPSFTAASSRLRRNQPGRAYPIAQSFRVVNNNECQ